MERVDKHCFLEKRKGGRRTAREKKGELQQSALGEGKLDFLHAGKGKAILWFGVKIKRNGVNSGVFWEKSCN